MTTTATADELGITLTTSLRADGEGDSVVPVRWCVGRALVQHLKDRDVDDAQVLIVVTHPVTDTETDRYLVPLTNEMAFVRFRRPGANVVRAAVVSPDSLYGLKKVREKVLGRDKDGWDYNVMDALGSVSTGYLRPYGTTDRITVSVPEEMFAKEPSRAVKTYVKWLFPRWRFYDECGWRKQKLLAFGLSPFVLVYLILRELLLIPILFTQSFFGFRGARWGLLVHPLRNPIEVANPDPGTCRWLQKKDGTDTTWLMALNPVTVLAVTLFGVLIGSLVSWLFDVTDLTGFFIGLGIVGSALVLLALTGDRLSSAITRWGVAMRRRAAETEAREHREALEDLESLVCNGGPRPATLGAVPRHHRTARLRYQAVKARVCKQFAR